MIRWIILPTNGRLMRADVSRESLTMRPVGAVITASDDKPSAIETTLDGEAPDPEADRRRRDSSKTGTFARVRLTDPDTSLATSGRNRRLKPSDKRHGVIDDPRGVVLDVEVTTGEVNDGEQFLARLSLALMELWRSTKAPTCFA